MKKLCAGFLVLMHLALLPLAMAQEVVSISTPQQLLDIRQHPGGHYRLAGHIDMEGVQWLPIPFSGTLDGAGYSIYNLRVSQPGNDTAVTVDGNDKEYDTRFAGLFRWCGCRHPQSGLENVQVDIDTQDNCFAAGWPGLPRMRG